MELPYLASKASNCTLFLSSSKSDALVYIGVLSLDWLCVWSLVILIFRSQKYRISPVFLHKSTRRSQTCDNLFLIVLTKFNQIFINLFLYSYFFIYFKVLIFWHSPRRTLFSSCLYAMQFVGLIYLIKLLTLQYFQNWYPECFPLRFNDITVDIYLPEKVYT